MRTAPLVLALPIAVATGIAALSSSAPSLAAPPAPTAKPPATAAAAAAASTSNASTPPAQMHLDVRQAKLDNGLRVVMSPDHTSPTIAVDVVYDVGGRNEERGHAGFAHLFEHMMFQGSANVPRGSHFQLVTSHGGTLNGTTSSDRTNYFELMPQSELALALWLEADRMKTLDITQKNLENQRDVVKEEFRMRIENRPYVPASIRLQEMVFQGYWPYEHPAIGNMKDLDAAQLDWVKSFHDAYYAPNNAVLAIAGDFDPDAAMALVHKYFDGAKPQPSIPKYDPGAMPEQTSPREAVVEDSHAKLPALLYGWAIPSRREKDHYALELAALLLAGGESSRLHRALVREQSLAAEVEAGTNDHRGPDMFEIVAKISGTGSIAKVQKLIDAQIADVAKLGPSDADMQKLKNQLAHGFLFGLQSNFARAQQLAEYELYFGDAKLLNDELARYLAVTKEDIKRVVATYLTRARRTQLEVKPAAPPAQGGQPTKVTP